MNFLIRNFRNVLTLTVTIIEKSVVQLTLTLHIHELTHSILVVGQTVQTTVLVHLAILFVTRQNKTALSQVIGTPLSLF